MKKSDLLEMFKYNEFKKRILNEKVTTDTTTVYKCGPLIDLCRGPHVRHTGKVKALKITKVIEIFIKYSVLFGFIKNISNLLLEFIHLLGR